MYSNYLAVVDIIHFELIYYYVKLIVNLKTIYDKMTAGYIVHLKMSKPSLASFSWTESQKYTLICKTTVYKTVTGTACRLPVHVSHVYMCDFHLEL